MSLRTLSDAALADRYDAVLMPGGVFLQSGRQFTRAEFEAWLAHGGYSVPDPVADTARALAEKWRAAVRDREASIFSVARGHYDAQRVEVEDAARACGPQVYAAFNALLTGDATRAPGVKP